MSTYLWDVEILDTTDDTVRTYRVSASFRSEAKSLALGVAWQEEPTLVYLSAGIVGDEPHDTYPCHCEHAQHAPYRWCGGSSEHGAFSDYVGNVCPDCALHCVGDYIIWPTAVHDGRSVYTCTIAAYDRLRAVFPDTYFPTRPGPSLGEVFTLLTDEQWQAAKAATKGKGE